jgi:CheY-like chemotaxis protein
MLEELGYVVTRAANADEALQKLEAVPDLEVMVTDVRMPGMSGLELAELAGQRRRNLKIVVISGYFLPQPIHRRFLQKPFRTQDLDAAIQAELAIPA